MRKVKAQARPASTSEPACFTCVPSTSRNAACSRCVPVWLRRMALRRSPSTTVSTFSPTCDRLAQQSPCARALPAPARSIRAFPQPRCCGRRSRTSPCPQPARRNRRRTKCGRAPHRPHRPPAALLHSGAILHNRQHLRALHRQLPVALKVRLRKLAECGAGRLLRAALPRCACPGLLRFLGRFEACHSRTCMPGIARRIHHEVERQSVGFIKVESAVPGISAAKLGSLSLVLKTKLHAVRCSTLRCSRKSSSRWPRLFAKPSSHGGA